MRTAGVILCGGQSSRMGGPKAWLPVGDETMLVRVVRLLGEVVSPLVLVAAPGQHLPPLDGDIEVVRDPITGRGPLVGILAGMKVPGMDVVGSITFIFILGTILIQAPTTAIWAKKLGLLLEAPKK